MSLVQVSRFSFYRQGRTNKRIGRMRSTLAFGLAVLLALSPVLLRVSAQESNLRDTPEVLLEQKGDPLLQSVRRAALADRRRESANAEEYSSKQRYSSELDSLSNIASTKRLPDGRVKVNLTVRLTGHSVSELINAGFDVGARVGDVATVETDIERLTELAALPSVRKMSAATYSYPTNDLTRQATGVDDASGIRQITQTGRGVIVGMIDTGIDFRHLDFTVPGTNGKQTRIKGLLDMTIYSQQSTDWNYSLPGSFASIGHFYSEADINAALQLPPSQTQNSDIVKERDKHGHGTFTAGIAAGNGLAGPQPGKYAGMAPESDLVVVKVTRDNSGSGSSNNSDIINAMKFIQQTAAEMGKPFVINMSLGTNVGSHDGTMDQERAIDEVVGSGTGRAFCIATGNYGHVDVHASGNLSGGSSTSLTVNVNAGSSPQFFGLSYSQIDSLSVTLFRPDGTKMGPVAYSASQGMGFSNQYVDIYNTLDDKRDSDPQNDQKAVAIFFKDPAAGLASTSKRTWTVMLETGVVNNGRFDAWIEIGKFTSFVDGSRRLSSTATARGAITVGGYVTRPSNFGVVGDFASFTGVGPTADGREKPDIVTPSFIYSSNSSVGIGLGEPPAPDSVFHIGAQGTSASAPVVAGGVALILQQNPNLSSEEIKTLLKTTATHDAFTGGSNWHERFGSGKLNIATALQALTTNQLQFSAPTYGVSEGDGSIGISVTRAGDTSAPAAIDYATGDNAALADCSLVNGVGSSRCDYATTIGTLRFAAGENSKTIFIPVVDDGYAESSESFSITLSHPVGTTLGPNNTATITIQDNDAANGPNPIDGVDFFIRQQYIDFLGREPDPAGLAGWRNVLNNCGITIQPPCDRIEVSAGFFRSEEFQSRGYYIYRFYSAVGKIPLSDEFYPDFAKVSGFLTNDQLEANKAAYVNEVMSRDEFQTRYATTFSDPTAYVDALLQTVGLPNHPERQVWINQLNTNNTSQGRGQVLRALVESSEVFSKYFNEAFVIMQYFGYLRRTADASYLNWIQTMDQTGGNYRIMINGFINSSEYRRRFGN
ncbi:MAG TPA: S8 family serine peptidase [Pyrinomonadaceae bacterium]|nr:S8 family serine peptidase [Pyrinomonadaceae bacterium]